jgi:hypothetical protein
LGGKKEENPDSCRSSCTCVNVEDVVEARKQTPKPPVNKKLVFKNFRRMGMQIKRVPVVPDPWGNASTAVLKKRKVAHFRYEILEDK